MIDGFEVKQPPTRKSQMETQNTSLESYLLVQVKFLSTMIAVLFIFIFLLGMRIVSQAETIGELRGTIVTLKTDIDGKQKEIDRLNGIIAPIQKKVMQGAAWINKRYGIPMPTAVSYSWETMSNSLRTDMPYLVVMATIWKESDFRAHIASYNGTSHGLMMIHLKAHIAKYKFKLEDLYDPSKNIRYGTDIMKEYYADTGSLFGMLKRYYGSTVPEENDVYASDVMWRAHYMAKAFDKST